MRAAYGLGVEHAVRRHHIFHQTTYWPQSWSPDTVFVISYISGMAFVACMFAAMGAGMYVDLILWFTCLGFGVIAMLVASLARHAFEDRVAMHMFFFERETHAGTTGSHYSFRSPGLMPRLSVLDILQGQLRA